jgi:[glutamine synthetase] adenylyltransferase / [glutamine synthetase]-adenylyl-L-tyrosine phosphorylase
VLDGELARAMTAHPLRAALRHVRADELVRLGVRELEGLEASIGRELAHLAEACFDVAIAEHGRELTARHGRPRYVDDNGIERDATLCVVGMGKLGGEELNFASDVDVIYVYSSDNGAAGELSLHEYFAKLCAQLTAALGEVTEDDMVFALTCGCGPRARKARSRARSTRSSGTTKRSGGRGSARRGSKRTRAQAIARSAPRS